MTDFQAGSGDGTGGVDSDIGEAMGLYVQDSFSSLPLAVKCCEALAMNFRGKSIERGLRLKRVN